MGIKEFHGRTPSDSSTGAYKSFDDKSKSSVLSSYGKTIDNFNVVTHRAFGIAGAPGPFDNVVKDIDVRVPHDIRDYEYFRPNEATPKKFKDIVNRCRTVYVEEGIIRNVIDMMTDFACEDLRIQSPDKKVEAFFKVWMKKVSLSEAAREFVRHFLVDGNVVIKRITAKVPKPVQNELNKKAIAKPDLPNIKTDNSDMEKWELPWRYMFLNIAALQWSTNQTYRLVNKPQLMFRVPLDVISMAKSPADDSQRELIQQIPADILSQIRAGHSLVALDMTKLSLFYNKKDSWEQWAPPFLISVLKDVMFKNKLRQAETAALDGIINVIRVWKLGDHKEGILPDDAAISKLINLLDANVGGGAMDIVWDTMIDMEPFYPPVDQILGSEKYVQVNKDILIGLGVPEVLIGGEGANFSNSWIQLKTLVERLEYIRSKLEEWISREIEIVCKAVGFDSTPTVKFNEMSLEDESTNRKLIVGLLDRGVVSVEAVLEAYGADFLTEIERMRKEKQSGIKALSPLDKPLPKPGNGPPSQSGKPATTDKGRPPASKDSSTRTARKPKVRTKAMLFALEAIDCIDEHVMPLYMSSFGIDNARKLTTEQKEKLNIARSTVLACIKIGDDLSEDGILDIAENAANPNLEVIKAINEAIANFASEFGHAPNLVQRKRLEAISWSDVINDEE